MAHTPGPWMSTQSGPVMRGYTQPFAVGQYGMANLIAGVFGDVAGGIDTAQANARLIAAAPTMLEALIAVRDAAIAREGLGQADYNAVGAKVRDAISKAEGR